MTPLDAMKHELNAFVHYYATEDISFGQCESLITNLRTAITEMEKASAVELAAVIKEHDEWKIGAQEGRKAQEKYMELCEQLVACEKERDELITQRADILNNQANLISEIHSSYTTNLRCPSCGESYTNSVPPLISTWRIAEMEKAEPVAWMDRHGGLLHERDRISPKDDLSKVWTPLYAAPPTTQSDELAALQADYAIRTRQLAAVTQRMREFEAGVPNPEPLPKDWNTVEQERGQQIKECNEFWGKKSDADYIEIQRLATALETCIRYLEDGATCNSDKAVAAQARKALGEKA